MQLSSQAEGAWAWPVDCAAVIAAGDFSALGGSRWAEAEVTAFAGASTIAVDGIDSVVLSPYYGDTTRVDAFDGPNWVSFSVRHASNAGHLRRHSSPLDTTAIE